ncbi:hypothetical protein E8E14_012713 [Neopestalotiopsis sp. 37M]|nr:hypothetical protein E8E14_012713 [Neopestalotiopsis sp. 37M]
MRTSASGLLAIAAAIGFLPAIQAQYSGSNWVQCWGDPLPNGTTTRPDCCVSYTPSTDGLYTGQDCVGAYTSSDSSIFYCANGHPIEPQIPGAVLPGCCAYSVGTTAYLCKPKPVSDTE